MGKSCNCCKTGCPKCALCERTLTKLKFSFLNDNAVNDYKVEIDVNEPINAPCLKFFYIGDATGYYKPDGTRVPYRMCKIEITASPGTNFSEDLIPCTSINNNHTITKVQRNANKIEVIFPDERFYRQKANRNFLPDIVQTLSFRYANDKKAEFVFSPWDIVLFQAHLRDYESLDPSLAGKYPELKDCTVNITFSDLLGGGSLFRSVIDGDLKCAGTWGDYDHYKYIHKRCFACRTELGGIYQTKTLDQWHMDGFTYSHTHANYKKIYHGFLVVVNSGSISIYPNIQESLTEYPSGKTKTVAQKVQKVTKIGTCVYDQDCTGKSETANCVADIGRCTTLETLEADEEFDGDLSPVCPSCGPCTDISDFFSSFTRSKPYLCTNSSQSFFLGINSEVDIATPDPERTWQDGCCCSDRIRATDTYFDFALSYFTSGTGSFPTPINSLWTRCAILSIASKASVTLEFRPLGNPLTQPGTESPANSTGARCLSSLPSDFFIYTIGGIPKIKGFELDLGFYGLKCSTDFNDRLAPVIWSGDSASFVSANNTYETGILDCDIDGYKDSLINDSISFYRFDSNFNRVSEISTLLTSDGFFESKTKYLSNRPSQPAFGLNYFNQTQPSIEFVDRINANPQSDLYKLMQNVIFTIKPVFITDRINTPVGLILTPLSRLKMYIEVQAESTKPVAGFGALKYTFRSGTIDINNPNDVNTSFIIDLGRVGVNFGSVLNPGGVRFIPDPVFDNRSMIIKII